MKPHLLLPGLVLLLALLLVSCPVAPLAPAPTLLGAETPAGPVVLRDCLVIKPVGHYGRSPIHTDAIEAEVVAGLWQPPQAGDKVTLPDESTQTWDPVKAGEDGALAHEALKGGYLYWKVHADAAGVRILEASGSLTTYVNGEPRAGDVYSHGIVRLPVALKAGANDLLFHCVRGRLQARLVPVVSPALLGPYDCTLPDLLEGEKEPQPAAIVVTNATTETLGSLKLRASRPGAEPVTTAVPPLPPLSQRKVGFTLPAGVPVGAENVDVQVVLETGKDDPGRSQRKTVLRLAVRKPGQPHKRTFRSQIDGSVQYYAVVPARPVQPGEAPAGTGGTPGLLLTLHGAGVEAPGQAACYAPKPWAHVVAPTNRRSFGFDWEDWGRLDALEVLELAQKQFHTDPRRTWLTGHSMGGHGTWHLGLTYPDRFAAIAPSAGWISFWSYTGGPKPDNSALQQLLHRPTTPSDTLALVRNSSSQGVYVMHGEKDDNVPVGQARMMRQQLGTFHPDFVYQERPGAGHWYGGCVDWAPLTSFLAAHSLPKVEDVRAVDFVTASPGVSARCHWASIEAQVRPLQVSSVKLTLDAGQHRFSGTTDNVARLALDVGHLKSGEPLSVELDGQKLEKLPWPEGKPRLWLRRVGDGWVAEKEPAAALKGPHRYGPFKEAFRNRMVFVYGTKGTDEENAWAYARARFDAETFWYRGNGSVDMLADTAFDAGKDKDRNVILYGHAESNAAWPLLLKDSPVQVKRGSVQVGTRKETGSDLGCLFVRPRPDSDRGLVGVVSGSGTVGMRLTDRMQIFVSGLAYPDCLVVGADALKTGFAGVRGAGFFGPDWGVPSGEFVWGKRKGEL